MKILLISLALILNINLSANDTIKILKPKEIKFAQKFNLRFEILNYNGEKISVSTENLKNSDFICLGFKEKKGVLELTLIPFNIGISTFPAIEIYLDNKKLTTFPFNLEISPLFNLKGSEELKDIIEIFRFLIWLKILIAVLLILIFYLFYKKLKNKKTKEVEIIPPDNRTPYEIAIDEIEKLIDYSNVKEFYSKLSDILRTYLEREFSFQATKMTTLDIIKTMKKEFQIELVIKTREVLENSDLAKFAKYEFEKEQLAKDRETAKEIITKLNIIELEKKKEEEEKKIKIETKNGI